MSRSFLWSLVTVALCVPAACGGRGALDGYELDGPDTGVGASTSNATGGASASSNSSTSSSSNGNSSVSVSASASSSSGGNMCDVGDCGTCVDCAVETTCSVEVNDCFSNNDCIAYNDCINGCQNGVPNCFEECAQDFPQGAQLYSVAVYCVYCDACTNSCEDQIGPGGCG